MTGPCPCLSAARPSVLEADHAAFCDRAPCRGLRDGLAERSGSLYCLNHLGVSMALRMLEDPVAEPIQESTWTHLGFDNAGRLAVTYPNAPQSLARECPICGPLAGLGEEGPRLVPEVLAGQKAGDE